MSNLTRADLIQKDIILFWAMQNAENAFQYRLYRDQWISCRPSLSRAEQQLADEMEATMLTPSMAA